jgi:hypothetical protein
VSEAFRAGNRRARAIYWLREKKRTTLVSQKWSGFRAFTFALTRMPFASRALEGM